LINVGNVINKYICVSVNHKKASTDVLKSVFFEDPRQGLLEFKSANIIEEIVLLQTCNRVETYIFSTKTEEACLKATSIFEERIGTKTHKYIEIYLGEQAVEHLFRVATSLDSMMVGEHEILGQVSEALSEAVKVGIVGPYLKTLFKKALVAGKRARIETEISKGPVSLAHAAVDMAEGITDLTRKRVLVVGAGRTGSLLASSLRAHYVKDVIILNRTFEKAVNIAEKCGYLPAPFTDLRKHLKTVDVMFVATSAPHYLIKVDDLADRKEHLLIFDLSNPRNVDAKVSELPGVQLKCLDDLRGITEKNKLKRLKEAKKVEQIIYEELTSLRNEIRKLVAEEMLKEILIHADEIRRRELERAIRVLDCERYRLEVLEAMSKSIVSKLLSPVIDVAKRAALKDDFETLSLISKLFKASE
jgi:glutamyl-tRNA reductase